MISESQRVSYTDVVNLTKVNVLTEKTSSKTISVKYTITNAKSETVKVRAVAFKDGLRSFVNIIPVKTGSNIPNGNEVTVDEEHSFVWNVPEDWDIDLAKVKVEILVQEGQLLPQELVTIPANGEHSTKTITRNTIIYPMAFNALLWCYAEGDEALTVNNGQVSINGTVISDSTYTQLLNYLYGKMGYKVLAGNDLTYAEQMTRLDLANGGLNQVSVKIEE